MCIYLSQILPLFHYQKINHQSILSFILISEKNACFIEGCIQVQRQNTQRLKYVFFTITYNCYFKWHKKEQDDKQTNKWKTFWWIKFCHSYFLITSFYQSVTCLGLIEMRVSCVQLHYDNHVIMPSLLPVFLCDEIYKNKVV